jgi:hypothetical protein
VNIKDGLLQTIRKGAALVGYLNHDRTVTLYFESNRFNDPLLLKWEHKARKAYERLTQNAPTVSKLVASYDYFEPIGSITGKSIHIKRMPQLKRWLEQSDALDTCPESEVVIRVAPVVKVDTVKV